MPGKSFACPRCGCVFSTATKLRIHVRTHTGERPHSCVCGKAFADSSNLAKHRKICSASRDSDHATQASTIADAEAALSTLHATEASSFNQSPSSLPRTKASTTASKRKSSNKPKPKRVSKSSSAKSSIVGNSRSVTDIQHNADSTVLSDADDVLALTPQHASKDRPGFADSYAELPLDAVLSPMFQYRPMPSLYCICCQTPDCVCGHGWHWLWSNAAVAGDLNRYINQPLP